MTIGTVFVSDERYAAQRPQHLHQEFRTEFEAWTWVHMIEDQLGRRIGGVAESVPDDFRCPDCGWVR